MIKKKTITNRLFSSPKSLQKLRKLDPRFSDPRLSQRLETSSPRRRRTLREPEPSSSHFRNLDKIVENSSRNNTTNNNNKMSTKAEDNSSPRPISKVLWENSVLRQNRREHVENSSIRAILKAEPENFSLHQTLKRH